MRDVKYKAGLRFVVICSISLILMLIPQVSCVYVDEVGKFDFKVSTAGHGGKGGVEYASFFKNKILTSGSDSCYVSGRDVTSGSLVWRRNACTSTNSSGISTAFIDDSVVTIDTEGVLRGWSGTNGDLLFDNSLPSSASEYDIISNPSTNIFAVVSSNDVGDSFSFHPTGELEDVQIFLRMAKVRKIAPLNSNAKDGKAKLISIVKSPNDSILALMAWIFPQKDSYITSVSNMVLMEFQSDDIQSNNIVKIQSNQTPLLVSSIYLTTVDDKVTLFSSIYDSQNSFFYGIFGGNYKIMPLPDTTTSFEFEMLDSSTLSITTKEQNKKVTIMSYQMSDTNLIPLEFEQTYAGIQKCMDTYFSLIQSEEGLSLIAMKNTELITSISINDILDESIHGYISNMKIQCSPSPINIFITTTGGTSTMITLSSSYDIISSWTQEEGLASITNSLFLDRSMQNPIDEKEEDDDEESLITLSTRLSLQFESIKSFISDFSHSYFLDLFTSSSSESRYDRDYHFGFAKVAVLLSKNTGRLFGLDTLKKDKKTILWSLLLNPNAIDHKLVHGGVSSNSGIDGGSSMVGSNELLILSSLKNNQMEYKCVDGIHGRVYSSGTLSGSLTNSQIIPVRALTHGHGGCKQIAILLNNDGSTDIIPKTDHTIKVVKDAMESSRNGFYGHTINDDLIQSYKLSFKDTNLHADVLGKTMFKGEQILNVVYPQRGEVVSSPATILGDDSLLLKYLNPHLVVIVTYREETPPNSFESAFLKAGSNHGTKKKKPLGATKPGETIPSVSTSTPNLFINLVDSASSKLLHRVSHSNASGTHPIPVTISENWIIYTFFNMETKRTDVGVMTLHEGMIDKYGITAFNTQVEQELEFSSFSSEKPIVLNKVYTLGQPKAVTALGVTQTVRGITSKHILFALGSHQILSVDRRWLDPRRPSGDPKKSEKVEGLQK